MTLNYQIIKYDTFNFFDNLFDDSININMLKRGE